MAHGRARGWAAATAGFVLTIVGLGIIIWQMFTVSPTTIPLNTTTFTGIGVAAIGIGLAAIGFEQGRPVGR